MFFKNSGDFHKPSIALTAFVITSAMFVASCSEQSKLPTSEDMANVISKRMDHLHPLFISSPFNCQSKKANSGDFVNCQIVVISIDRPSYSEQTGVDLECYKYSLDMQKISRQTVGKQSDDLKSPNWEIFTDISRMSDGFDSENLGVIHQKREFSSAAIANNAALDAAVTQYSTARNSDPDASKKYFESVKAALSTKKADILEAMPKCKAAWVE